MGSITLLSLHTVFVQLFTFLELIQQSPKGELLWITAAGFTGWMSPILAPLICSQPWHYLLTYLTDNVRALEAFLSVLHV